MRIYTAFLFLYFTVCQCEGGRSLGEDLVDLLQAICSKSGSGYDVSRGTRERGGALWKILELLEERGGVGEGSRCGTSCTEVSDEESLSTNKVDTLSEKGVKNSKWTESGSFHPSNKERSRGEKQKNEGMRKQQVGHVVSGLNLSSTLTESSQDGTPSTNEAKHQLNEVLKETQDSLNDNRRIPNCEIVESVEADDPTDAEKDHRRVALTPKENKNDELVSIQELKGSDGNMNEKEHEIRFIKTVEGNLVLVNMEGNGTHKKEYEGKHTSSLENVTVADKSTSKDKEIGLVRLIIPNSVPEQQDHRSEAQVSAKEQRRNHSVQFRKLIKDTQNVGLLNTEKPRALVVSAARTQENEPPKKTDTEVEVAERSGNLVEPIKSNHSVQFRKLVKDTQNVGLLNTEKPRALVVSPARTQENEPPKKTDTEVKVAERSGNLVEPIKSNHTVQFRKLVKDTQNVGLLNTEKPRALVVSPARTQENEPPKKTDTEVEVAERSGNLVEPIKSNHSVQFRKLVKDTQNVGLLNTEKPRALVVSPARTQENEPPKKTDTEVEVAERSGNLVEPIKSNHSVQFRKLVKDTQNVGFLNTEKPRALVVSPARTQENEPPKKTDTEVEVAERSGNLVEPIKSNHSVQFRKLVKDTQNVGLLNTEKPRALVVSPARTQENEPPKKTDTEVEVAERSGNLVEPIKSNHSVQFRKLVKDTQNVGFLNTEKPRALVVSPARTQENEPPKKTDTEVEVAERSGYLVEPIKNNHTVQFRKLVKDTEDVGLDNTEKTRSLIVSPPLTQDYDLSRHQNSEVDDLGGSENLQKQSMEKYGLQFRKSVNETNDFGMDNKEKSPYPVVSSTTQEHVLSRKQDTQSGAAGALSSKHELDQSMGNDGRKVINVSVQYVPRSVSVMSKEVSGDSSEVLNSLVAGKDNENDGGKINVRYSKPNGESERSYRTFSQNTKGAKRISMRRNVIRGAKKSYTNCGDRQKTNNGTVRKTGVSSGRCNQDGMRNVCFQLHPCLFC